MSNMQLFTYIFVTASMVLAIVFAGGVRRLFKKRWTMVVVGVVLLALVAGTRYLPDAIFAVNGMYGISKWPNLLITDTCPMFALVLFISMTLNNRFIVMAVAPICLMGGLMTLYGEFGVYGYEQNSLINGIFYDYQMPFGSGGSPHNFGYFSTHYAMAIAAICVMVAYSDKNWRHILAGGVSFGLQLSYAALIMGATGLNYNVSGLHLNDWTTAAQNNLVNGEYHTLQDFFNTTPSGAQATFFTVCVFGYLAICAVEWIYARRLGDRKLRFMHAAFAT